MIYPFIPTKMARFFFLKEYKCWWGRGKTGILVHCWWECKMEQSLWKTVWWFLKKLNMKLPYDPAIPLSGNIPQRVESRDLNRYLYANVCCSIIHKSWKAETTQESISRQTDKQDLARTYNRILLSLKKEYNFDTCYNMNEPRKHHAKWKKVKESEIEVS